MELIRELNPFMHNLLRIVIIIGMAILLDRTLRFVAGRFLAKSAVRLNVDKTRYVFFKHVISAVIYTFAIIAVIYSLPRFKTVAVSMFAGAGILAAIIGFASQAAFSNIISGIFMVISRPFKVGDRVELGQGLAGVVEDITLRHTVIRNAEHKRIIVPNSKMSSDTIINANIYDDKVKRFVEFTVDYKSDIDLVMQIMREECEAHPRCLDNRSQQERSAGAPKVDVRLVNVGTGDLKMRATPWVHPDHAGNLHTDLNISIKKRFDAAGIRPPSLQPTIIYAYGNHPGPESAPETK